MSQSARQRNLFAAEDFSVAYDSFKQANFKSYDFDTIRTAMVEYIRETHPESFNDWIKSSEFVALIELMAFLGHNLAFRTDLSVRENFLSTAERRQSVLRLADFLGYTPLRGSSATGFLKIKTVKTNQNIFNSIGENIRNRRINFVPSQTDETSQDFITVMNEIFQRNNRFGSPVDSVTISGNQDDLYNLNSVARTNQTIPYTGSINGRNYTFEIYNPMLLDESIGEKPPNIENAFSIIYRNDRQGISSPNTGFFVGFKQGKLDYTDYQIDSPTPNTFIDINVENINNSDVWVQTIDEYGFVLNDWLKVDRYIGAEQAVADSNRKLFTVKTLDNDKISIRFGDGVFSDLPRGTIRVWYRNNVNQSYTVNNDNFGEVSFSINYLGKDGNEYRAQFTAELEESVTNASIRESIQTIKEKASRAFSTHDRMITAEDYSIYPMTQNAGIRKIKSINRTYSGHSRFLGFDDPTAQYQNVNIFSDDGYLYVENTLERQTILDVGIAADLILDQYFAPILTSHELVNFFYYNYEPYGPTTQETFVWQQVSAGPSTSTGYLTYVENSQSLVAEVGDVSSFDLLTYFKKGAMIEFIDQAGEAIWARVNSIYLNGQGATDEFGFSTGLDNRGRGAIILSRVVPDDAVVNRIFPAFDSRFSAQERLDIIEEISLTNTFGIMFDPQTSSWQVIGADNLAKLESASMDNFSFLHAGDASNNNLDNSWLIRAEYTNGEWVILYRKTNIVFGSEKSVRFYNQNSDYKFNSKTDKPEKDRIKILSLNKNLVTNDGFNVDLDLYSMDHVVLSNGYTDDKRVLMSLEDLNNDMAPDNPMLIKEYIAGSAIGVLENVENNIPTIEITDTPSARSYSGRRNLKFQWIRIADTDKRIDPAVASIIDTFVLTNGYDREYRNWLANKNSTLATEPKVLDSDDLSLQFKDISKKKSATDTVIYRSGKYKILFGPRAQPELQARFRVIRATGTSLNDGEIKNRIVSAVRNYFAIENWDFGETFYYTELSTYVHNELVGNISGIIIVPTFVTGKFGNLFEIKPSSEELFIPDINTTMIDIVDEFNNFNMRVEQ